MATVSDRLTKAGTPFYQVRWRDSHLNRRMSRSFAIRTDATFLRDLLNSNNQSLAVVSNFLKRQADNAPSFAEASAHHLDQLLHVGGDTIGKYRGYLRNHLIPTFGGMGVDKITRSDIVSWVRSMQTKAVPAAQRLFTTSTAFCPPCSSLPWPKAGGKIILARL